ncbi:helix-turn-helix transcriptional regulator [Pseudonocardia pini]|uniref:helix-turn-helix transcriptional regulator n=1 Tax=Pseudonocardia pini TaxID=2758030 RepID=UPI0015F00415|nr:helix-turn-helix domain-containing protein [Pseudonocardia pini]
MPLKKPRDPVLLEQAREERDLTYGELARLAECTRQNIHLVFNGQATDASTALLIARSLRRSVRDLFVPMPSRSASRSVQTRSAA